MERKQNNLIIVIVLALTLILGWALFGSHTVLPSDEGHPPIYALIDQDRTTRQVGTEGHEAFETVLLEEMASAGLKPEGPNFRMPFDMIGMNYDLMPSFSIINAGESQSFSILEDFQTYYNEYTGSIDYNGELLVLDSTYYSLPSELLEGKVVVTKFNVITDEIIQYARENGVRGLLIYEDSPQKQGLIFNPYIGEKRANDIYVAKITSETYVQLKTIADENRLEGYEIGPLAGRVDQAKISVKDTYPILSANNLVGKRQGQSQDRFVVFYTYYDSMGYYLGMSYPNVIQKLSGVSALVEMMQYAAQMSQPEVDIYFAFIDGGASGNEGIDQLKKELSKRQGLGEYIEIGILGMSGNSDINIATSNGTQSANKYSAILGSRVAQYIETSGLSVGNAIILPTDGANFLVNQSLPSVLITQNVNDASFQKLLKDDTITSLDITAYQTGVDALKSLMINGYYKVSIFSMIPNKVKVGVFLTWLIVSFVILVSALKNQGRSQWVKLQRSTLFQILERAVVYIVPTLVMLVFLLFILLVPSDITKADYGGQYTNYVFGLHFQRVVHYGSELLSGAENYLTPSLKTALLVGFKNTLRLFISTVLISSVLGLLIGMWRGLKKNTALDVLVLILYAIPDVLISLLGIYGVIILYQNELLFNISPEDMRTKYMPVVVMSIVPTIYIIRLIQMRTEQVLTEPFVFGEIARGVTQKRLIWHHLLPMLISFLCTSMSSILRIIMVNLLVVEYLYASVGIGAYLIINRFDPTYVLLISLLFGGLFIVTNAIFKGINYWIDPMRRRS